jgi:hypothetical protein
MMKKYMDKFKKKMKSKVSSISPYTKSQESEVHPWECGWEKTMINVVIANFIAIILNLIMFIHKNIIWKYKILITPITVIIPLVIILSSEFPFVSDMSGCNEVLVYTFVGVFLGIEFSIIGSSIISKLYMLFQGRIGIKKHNFFRRSVIISSLVSIITMTLSSFDPNKHPHSLFETQHLQIASLILIFISMLLIPIISDTSNILRIIVKMLANTACACPLWLRRRTNLVAVVIIFILIFAKTITVFRSAIRSWIFAAIGLGILFIYRSFMCNTKPCLVKPT